MSSKRRVCIYCGSKTGENPTFTEQARELGTRLASNEIEVVYGGGSIGLMNEVANATFRAADRSTGSFHSICTTWKWPTNNLLHFISPTVCTSEKR